MNTFDGRRGEYIRDAFWRLALAQGETDLRVAMDAFQERSNLFINGAEVKTQGLLASMFERMIAETERKLS